MQDSSVCEKPVELDEADKKAMRSYILNHPEFILDDIELMRSLIAPQNFDGRQVVDFQSALINRLENNLKNLRDVHKEIIENVYENMDSIEIIQKAVLTVLSAYSFEQFLQVISVDFKDLLQVNVVRLVLETDSLLIDQDADEDEAAQPIVALDPGVTQRLLEGLRCEDCASSVILRSTNHAAMPLIYGVDADLVKSEALIPLDFGPDLRPGLLVLGSVNEDRFVPEQETFLLGFLGQVVERVMGGWLIKALS